MPNAPVIGTSRPAEVVARENGLTIGNARKTFATPEGGVVKALDGVSLQIRDGEFFVMLGPSGCGKTTLLRAIAGLEILDSGEIYLGRDRIDSLPAYSRPVNTVFQSYALFPHLTVADNIAFGLQMERVPKAEIATRVAEMMALVRLDGLGGRLPSQLSGGQQQRVALARALAKRPRVLLLDEPLAALDLKLRRGMQDELRRLQRTTGVTFVFVTHDQEEALSLGDRIAVFSNGIPVQVGTAEEIYERPVNRFVADFIGESNFLTVPLNDEGEFRVADGPWLELPEPVFAGPDGTLTVAVRPERLVLDGSAPELVRGRLSEVVYMGTDLHVRVALSDGTSLAVRVSPPFEQLSLTPGADVVVGASPSHLRPLAVEL
ncbi:spermidine/putrescine transport system ATP-binding protein [Propionicimonas paludicola]|uniref:Spermidine/putrescine transport system ATP-binding protein n=1 Tax=Propionicimonas paludicola TaxID=185243 RepID=A0A2A9CT87_9ACTN|nr:ABC transporter ATP-binding protein [Propionicimonas paludicola]PFG17265.1 spermidine/putrescine transport system ATP-binding protein [Propionicimonas paludicola]